MLAQYAFHQPLQITQNFKCQPTSANQRAEDMVQLLDEPIPYIMDKHNPIHYTVNPPHIPVHKNRIHRQRTQTSGIPHFKVQY